MMSGHLPAHNPFLVTDLLTMTLLPPIVADAELVTRFIAEPKGCKAFPKTLGGRVDTQTPQCRCDNQQAI